jgi:hypothetical protein
MRENSAELVFLELANTAHKIVELLDVPTDNV